METRKATNKILEMIDEGILNPTDVVTMCLKYMSEDEVEDMARINEIYLEDEEDEDEEEPSYYKCSEEERQKLAIFEDDAGSWPYIINVGESRFDMHPLKAAPTEEIARTMVDELCKTYKCVEAVYMPENNDDINEVIYSWYLD